MRIFDWLFGNSEKNKVDDKIKSKSDNILIENIMFKNVNGIDFNMVRLAPKGDSPEEFLTSDIDGSWYYAQNQMVMLFKAFSFEKFDLALTNLLKANNLKYENYVEKNTIKYWYGNDFKIEVPPVLGQAQLIIITNEDIVPVDSLEFQKTDLTDVTYDLDWVKGFTIYDGSEILKKDYQFGKSLNVPAYFNEHGHEYILIKVTTETIAKNLVDKIIENNGGKLKFKAESAEGWFYPHRTDFFVVGFLIEHSVVRVNKL